MTDSLEAQRLRRLQADDIEYFYQPVYGVITGTIDKAEVLLRVRDGLGGYMDTERVVTAAEELGLIDNWDKQAFTHTCRVLPQFLAHGIQQLSVNLSPAACHNPALVPEVRRILGETQTDPSHICIEVTEVAKLIDEKPFNQAIRELYDMGVNIAIDDFGKGYSNLQRMLAIPFHILKLDKSLIWSMDEHDLAAPLVRNMINFVRQHNILAVAEGIETVAQARALANMGCHYLQGYYFSPPIDKTAFFTYIDTQKRCSAGS